MQERNATSEPDGQSAWDLFPSEHPDGRVPPSRPSPGAVAPRARATAAVQPPRALRERESMRQWIVGNACDLLMLLAIAMARVSNMTSGRHLPHVRAVMGEGLAIMTGTMLAVLALVMTGSPARVESPEVLEAAASPVRVEADEVAASRRDPVREAATRSTAAPVRAGASDARPSATTKNPEGQESARLTRSTILPPAPSSQRSSDKSDVTADVPATPGTAIASTIATAAVPSVDAAAVPAPPFARSGPEAPAVSTSMMAPSPAANPVPTASPTVTAAVPVSPAPVRPRSAAVQGVLNRYRDAFSALDPSAAKAVWPSADAISLGKAFDRLREQQMVLGPCNISVIGARAVASCEGTVRYVPNVGSRSPRVQRGRWDFTLREVGDDWRIETVKAR